MTKETSTEKYLKSAPAAVRATMTDKAVVLQPGAAAVVGRFFETVARHREPFNAPSARSFRLAAASESTFRLLLRSLAVFAPMVTTVGAIDVKKEWVAKRPAGKPACPRLAARTSEEVVATWPATWQSYYCKLAASHIKSSSLNLYRSSIDQCAQLVNEGVADEHLGFMTGYQLAQAFPKRRKCGNGEIRKATIANYLEGLVALGRCGGSDPDGLIGLRLMRDHLQDEASLGDKFKIARIGEIMEKGGFGHVADCIATSIQAANNMPDHAAAKVLTLQTAAVVAVAMNKPGRTSDVSRWLIGNHLSRSREGTWTLEWMQEKTGHTTAAGALWPEIGEILDQHILGGRPDRFIHLRYGELEGKNWLTLMDNAMDRRWPSQRSSALIGIPLHDLRTLAADYLRRYDPSSAAQIITTHLGHSTGGSEDDYRTSTDGEAAGRDWSAIRKTFA